MKALSNLDASWLHGETARMPFHVANLFVFDQPRRRVDLSTALRDLFERKLHRLPVLHRRLDPTSLKLANPVWLDDPEIDWDYHLQRAQVAAPGGRDELNDLLVELHRPLLDRAHPLWQAWLIEGLADGQFAIYLKLHHAAGDGGAVNAVIDALFAPEADAAAGDAIVVAPERAPNPFELLWKTTYDYWIGNPLQLGATMREITAAALKPGTTAQPAVQALQHLTQPVPRTPFNRGVSVERRYGMASIPLAEAKALGKANDGTINDVVLAVCTGALRAHLERRGELPDQPLVAGMPVSVRDDGDRDGNNQINLMLARLPAHDADRSAWLPQIRESVGHAKTWLDATRPIARLMVQTPSLRAPRINNLASLMEGYRAAEDLGTTDRLPPFVNLWISNVAGPRTPLKFAGQDAKTNLPIGLVMHGAALNITVISYLDRLDFGVLASPEAVEDAQELADLLVAEFAALKAALH